MQTQTDANQKMEPKPYHKPKIERVQLLPDENVLGGCETVSGYGFEWPGCANPTPCIA